LASTGAPALPAARANCPQVEAQDDSRHDERSSVRGVDRGIRARYGPRLGVKDKV
jgi:hypothetical protein